MYSHAYRELLGADIIWDGAQMVLTLKLAGYVYFFPTFLVGPIFELNDYLAWTDDAQVAPVAVILPKLGTLIYMVWQFGEVGGVLAGYGYDPNTHEWYEGH
ncbi:hypothetical protein B5M09_008153 [Aphanomyces astaci]|uniref:Uncharacterized protein n=1 Tax=Aphanomyces astaci TaxID=112090 RepID=A0A3R7YG91_APHAT|nr:hypothetical protein B5M09_008153 [Aphanomyces astaci]